MVAYLHFAFLVEIMLRNPSLISILAIAVVCTLGGIPQPQGSNLTRVAPISLQQVPLASSGPANRNYDHATVAMNSDRDIIVAFHSTINSSLKQVEIACYEYQPGDTWNYMGTEIVGGTGHDPLQLVSPDSVKCERPDVVAVGDRFFVVWTRRYQGVTNHLNEPAVLECAWVDLSGGSIAIKRNAMPQGQGVELDAHDLSLGSTHDFWVRECGGVPDAVPLNDPNNPYSVAVVYPHQKQFSIPQQSEDRTFELRVVTCVYDDALGSVTPGSVELLVPTIQFNGQSSPNPGASSGGLILPEVAPSLQEGAFWLAAERQIEVGTPVAIEGKIYLGYWKWEADVWTEKASRTYQTGTTGLTYYRRRPMISAYPELGQSPTVGLAFNKIDVSGATPNIDVIYKQVTYDPTGGFNNVLAFPHWPNSTGVDDHKPASVMGRVAASLAVAYAGRTPGQGGASSDLINNNGIVIDTSPHITNSRPGLAYQYYSGATDPDYVAVCWEKTMTQNGQLVVWLGVE